MGLFGMCQNPPFVTSGPGPFLFGQFSLIAQEEGNEMAEIHEGGCLCGPEFPF